MNFKHTPEQARNLVADALESGEYEQGKGRLRTLDNKFCCLGVGCDLFAKHEGVGKWRDHYGKIVFEAKSEDWAAYVLPDTIKQWLGLRLASGGYGKDHQCVSEDNDTGKTFKEIAQTFRNPPENFIVQDCGEERT